MAADSSPARTSTVGTDPRNAVHTSVPPEIDLICAVALTSWFSQRYPCTESGEPVEPIARSDDRSATASGRTPAFLQTSMNPAEVPRTVTWSLPATSQKEMVPGRPSYKTTVAPTRRPPISRFHIIQPVVVYQRKR